MLTINKRSLIALSVATALTGLTACGGGGGGSSSPTVTESPSAISISATQAARLAANETVGMLTTTDADSTSFTYSVDSDYFSVETDGNLVYNGGLLHFPSDNAAITISVTVTDEDSNSHTETFDIQGVLEVPTTYSFESQITTGSSVSYTGQVARHVLITELNNFISSLDATDYADKDAVIAALNDYFRDPNETAVDKALTISAVADIAESSVNDISTGKNLVDKIAGNDAAGQHKDWSVDFEGWGAKGDYTPESLVDYFFGLLADQVVIKNTTDDRVDPAGNAISSVYVTESGLDLKQLIQKFLVNAVAFSQGADDYLDYDTDGKGLLSSNEQDGEKAYTKLEHQVDEGFGYYGAARDFLAYTDDEIASSGEEYGRKNWQGSYDTDGSGMIELSNGEFNLGHSTNSAKRDRGTADSTNPTDLTQDAFTAFVNLRSMASVLASDAGTAPTEEQLTAMSAQADDAVLAWEKSISATAVHYVNDTVADLETIKAGGYEASDFANLAKHWSELKGFALGLQFNRNSPLTDTQFAQLHTLIGDAPVITGDIDAYIADLIEARGILAAAYTFEDEHATNW